MKRRRNKNLFLFISGAVLLPLLLFCRSAAASSTLPADSVTLAAEKETAELTVPTPKEVPTVTPQPTPTPTLTPTPIPTPSPTPEPTPVRRLVALTFDDGPNSRITPKVLDTLKAYNVKATFFIIGKNIAGKEDILRRMAAEGHEIGYHTWNHGSMRTRSEASQQKDYKKWCEAMQAVLGEDFTVSLLRPPGGSINSRAKHMAKEFGCPIILWSVDTEDWNSKSAREIIASVKKDTKEGGIILMHDRLEATAKALPEIIEFLIAEGYELVTVPELLARFNTVPEPGKVYRSVPAE